MKLNIISSRSNLNINKFFEFTNISDIEVDTCFINDNQNPDRVASGRFRRYYIPNHFSTKDIRSFYKRMKHEFQNVQNGLSIEKCGNSYVGKLTDTAKNSEDNIKFALYSN